MRRAFLRTSAAAVSVVALLSFSVSALAANSSTRGRAAANTNLTIVEAGSTDFSSVDVPYWVKQLKKNGITAHFTEVADASTGLRTVIAGQADLFIGSLPTALLAIKNGGASIKVIAVNDQASDYVLASTKSVSLSNLSGQTLAIDTPGSAGQVAAQLAFRKVGISASSVHYVTVGSTSARETALLAGQVDIAPLHYPDALTAVATGKAKILLNAAQKIGPYLQSGLIASSKLLGKPSLAQTVVDDFLNAERWASTDKAGYISYAKSQNLLGGLTPAQASSTWDFYHSIKFFAANGGVCQSYISSFLTLNESIGQLNGGSIPKQSKWLDSAFVQNYLIAHHQKPTVC